jgi:2-polyprenyl-3-methyl-5-hydroxy-6-metoxy-1,4-benzoquinol methylase
LTQPDRIPEASFEKTCLNEAVPALDLVEVVDAAAFSSYQKELSRLVREAGRAVSHPRSRIDDAVQRRLCRQRGEALAALLDEEVRIRGKRVLDVGSGFGEAVLACMARGGHAEGIEPDEQRVTVSNLLLQSFGLPQTVLCASGEAIPYRDEEFDIVLSQHVLEHVEDLAAVVGEMIRVTRPGGYLLVSVPNYLFPYEGHYKMKWFPLTPKPIGKLILRLTGRDPEFLLKHINYTTYPRMMKIWRAHGLEITNLTRELMLAGRHRSRLYESRLVRTLALRLNLFPTVTWLLRKPAGPAPSGYREVA